MPKLTWLSSVLLLAAYKTFGRYLHLSGSLFPDLEYDGFVCGRSRKHHDNALETRQKPGATGFSVSRGVLRHGVGPSLPGGLSANLDPYFYPHFGHTGNVATGSYRRLDPRFK